MVDTFEQSLASAGDAVLSLADGPAREAASILESAFAGAGQTIEAALGKAARSGELDFARMAQSILADLARIAAEAALAKAGLGNGSPSFTLNLPRSSQAATGIGLKSEVAKAVTKAALLGGRYR